MSECDFEVTLHPHGLRTTMHLSEVSRAILFNLENDRP